MDSTVHPFWKSLLEWLASHGMDISPENLPVEARSSPGAGYGLFAIRPIVPSAPLFSIPPNALLNSLSLAPHYPPGRKKLTCTQVVSLHLLLHRPAKGRPSPDPLFGPYISVLPDEFDSHPLTWLWKKEHDSNSSYEAQLVNALPPRILEKLDKMANLYQVDWNTTKDYLETNPTLYDRRVMNNGRYELERDYLWAWLNVNTRCVYHRLMKSRSSPDNMTLCPILDFANHTATPPHTWPKPTQSELFDTGPLGKKLGEKFTLLAPSTAPTAMGDEIYLKYGPHSNATLFSEYGFVMESEHSEAFPEEFEVQGPIESLFTDRGEIGKWMKDCLIADGYWGDWTMHSTPEPAHPSYRLLTALRLYHILPVSTKTIPSDSDLLVDQWRETTLGKRDVISTENERLWRGTLLEVCKGILVVGEAGVQKIQQLASAPQSWVGAAKISIEALWGEEMRVAAGVIQSLENNEEF